MQKKMWTFRSRVLLVVFATVVFTAMTVQYSAQRETERAMLAAYEGNALNLINTVALNVESEYRSVLFHESVALELRKAELRNIVGLGIQRIEEYHRQQTKGLLSEAEAQQMALEDLRDMRYDDGVGYLWVNDTAQPAPRLVMHPTMPELEGTSLSDGPRFESVTGETKNLLAAFVDLCREDGEGYCDYLWPKPTRDGLSDDVAKISYLRLFEPWGWVIGTGVYIDDIEKEARKRLDAVLVELRETLSKVRIAETGHLFIFDGNQNSLVHPFLDSVADSRSPEMRTEMLGQLMVAAKTPTVPFDYIWSKPGNENEHRFLKRAYVTHFEPLDWSIGASFYVEEMELPARRLRSRIFLLSCLVLLAAIGLAVWISKGMMKPLRQLTLAATRIQREGFRAAEIPVSGTVETVDLGMVLRRMLSSIERSEQQLKNVNSYIGNVIDSMPSVLVGVDASGKVTQWNCAAERVTGLARTEATGRTLDRALPAMAPEMERVLAAMKNGETFSERRRIRREDDCVRLEDVTVYPLVADGVEGAVIRIDDVTERVRIEEMMVQSEKMLSVGGLAAGMAHEINNPLAGMIQTAGVLSSRLADDLPANARAAEEAGTSMEAVRRFMEARGVPRMLARIRQSGARAAELVSNMLSFARKSDRSFSSYDLAKLLDHTVDLAGSDYDPEREYDFRRIEIVRQYEEGVPQVPCEASKIQQVVLNLLHNGAEAMQEGLQASCESRQPRFVLRLAHEREAGRVRIEIEDNGPGMDEATLKRVFEPFFTTKRTDRGNGLGLSVSYFVVTETHGGEMSVESSPGKGARFVVRLPVGKGRKEAESSATVPRGPVSQPTRNPASAPG